MSPKVAGEEGKGMNDCSSVGITALDGMLIEDPQVIRRQVNVLLHPLTAQEHLIMRHTELMACQLSGDISKNEAYLQHLRTSPWCHGDRVLKNNIDFISTDAYNSEVDGTSVPLIPV